jgi:hypothetical protein
LGGHGDEVVEGDDAASSKEQEEQEEQEERGRRMSLSEAQEVRMQHSRTPSEIGRSVDEIAAAAAAAMSSGWTKSCRPTSFGGGSSRPSSTNGGSSRPASIGRPYSLGERSVYFVSNIPEDFDREDDTADTESVDMLYATDGAAAAEAAAEERGAISAPVWAAADAEAEAGGSEPVAKSSKSTHERARMKRLSSSMSGDGGLQVSIDGYEDGKFVSYEVLVTCEDCSWTVKHRFRHFVALSHALRVSDALAHAEKTNLPRLPPKLWRPCTAHSPLFLRTRAKDLDQFLQKLLERRRVVPGSAIAIFLECDANVEVVPGTPIPSFGRPGVGRQMKLPTKEE